MRKKNENEKIKQKHEMIRDKRVPLTVRCALQHYPLYRVSDASCTGQDAAPPEERHLLFREKYDVLSKEASQRVRALHCTFISPSSLSACILCRALSSNEMNLSSPAARNTAV